ncbi:metal-dependent hydrolase [Hahella sp. SMD15-11]|uniref:Metal-dependent hydrolase n=1 Tax=Thermohahella caldifontis TaxID=3142973 RepID=A0AB39UT66_9GAMM
MNIPHPLTARRIEIGLDGASAHWLAADPVMSHFFNAMSCLIPPVERVVIRILRELDSTTLPEQIARDVQGLIQQEAWHSRIHRQCNDALTGCGYRAAHRIGQALEKVLNTAVDVLPRQLVLSLPCAFELHTSSLSLAVLEQGQAWGLEDPRTQPAPGRVLHWHALEELEHQDVCRDLLHALAIHRAWYIGATLVMLPVLAAVVWLTHLYYLHADRSLYRGGSFLRFLGCGLKPSGPYMTLIRGVFGRLWSGKSDFGRIGRAGVARRLEDYAP